MDEPIVEVRDLTVEFGANAPFVRAVDGVSFSIQRGEMLAIVGESGCGKSALLQSLLALRRTLPGVVAGRVRIKLSGGEVIEPFSDLRDGVFREVDVKGRSVKVNVSRRWLARVQRRARAVRGTGVGLVLQNGRAALDPFYSVGAQVDSALRRSHPDIFADERTRRARDLLEGLGFPEPDRVLRAYAHELSGGMAQRAMLAIVFAHEPELLLLDELTTGLDVSLQAEILRLLEGLREKLGFSGVVVTHDLGIARRLADRTMIMHEGKVVQIEATEAIFTRQVALEPYTERLIHAGLLDQPLADHDATSASPKGTGTVLRVDRVAKRFKRKSGLGWFSRSEEMVALEDVSFDLSPGECLAIVGESGSGKTTLARILVSITSTDDGAVWFDGKELGALGRGALSEIRRNFQILFQNPYTSLNSEMTAVAAVEESLRLHRGLRGEEARREALRLLDGAGLGPRGHHRLGTMSGGERRRIGLLRALESHARLVVLDEPSSGLDAVYRREVSERIRQARRDNPHRTFVIISHNLGFVTRIAERVIVLHRGRAVEQCDVESFLDRDAAHHPYTKMLWESSAFLAGVDPTEPNRASVPPPPHSPEVTS